jgi:protein gp37
MPYGDGLNILTSKVSGVAGIDPYPFGFEPTFHRYRLEEPKHTKKPQNIFVCSMADLFGAWVPDEWIKQVFDACEAAPQHRYLFLTKNPERYRNVRTIELDAEHELVVSKTIKDQIWLGTTITDQQRYFDYMKIAVPYDISTFLSIEPIQERIDLAIIDNYANWVIVGSETGNRKNKAIPQKEWIDHIARSCRKYAVPVFMKESLRELMGDDFIQQYPW